MQVWALAIGAIRSVAARKIAVRISWVVAYPLFSQRTGGRQRTYTLSGVKSPTWELPEATTAEQAQKFFEASK